MSLWRHLSRGLRALANRPAADAEIAEEVEHYLAEAEAAAAARGLAPADARRAARLEAGNATALQEQVRSYGWEYLVETTFDDLRHAVRQLRRAPGFATIATLTLALGIGASTAIVSAVKPVLFDPLPYPDARRIVGVWDRSRDGTRADVAFGSYREIATRSRAFESLSVMRPWLPALTGGAGPDGARPERVDGQLVSGGFFATLGVAPVLGRDFTPFDDAPGRPAVVILSDGLWRRRFAADPAVVGRTITIDDAPSTVVGIMPATFENVLAPTAEAWAPLRYDPALPADGREWGHHLRMVGRLRNGVSTADAGRELAGIAQAPLPEFSRPAWASLESGLEIAALRDDVTGGVRPVLVALLGAVGVLLLIACVNVTNLLVARGVQRQGELSLRSALGAGRGRLIRQVLTESLLLALLGGAFGMVVAAFGVRGLVALSPPGLPRIGAVRLDAPVFAIALIVTAVVGLGVGLLPALRASRPLHGQLQRQSHRIAGDHRVTRGALVTGEVALALMLLVSAGLLLRSLQRVFAIAPGFEPAGLLTMQIQAASGPDDGATQLFYAAALEAVRRIPGVTSAALTSQLPLTGDLDRYGLQFESSPSDGSGEDGAALRYAVSPGYLETMGIPLRRGRLIDRRDRAGAPVAVLINESLARRKFPGRDPIGQRLHFGSPDQPWYTVVGVVGDVRQTSLALTQPDAVYISAEQWYFADRLQSLVVRARGDVAALTPLVRSAIWSVDPNRPIVRVATMKSLLADSAAERRFALTVFGAFAVAALMLAAAGIYGVVSGSVTERMREIGVRSALGASRGSILGLIMRQGMTLAVAGVSIGVVGAVAATGALAGLLFGVSRLDPGTHAAVVALLLGVSALACWVPAWRAARIDPAITLRGE